MKKTLIISFFLFLVNTASVFAQFPDVSNFHLNREAVNYVKENGIVSGYPDGSFKPDNKINRAEFTSIIVRAFFSESEISGSYCFSDVLSDKEDSEEYQWFAGAICKAKKEGLISGYPDGKFRPENNIKFVEAGTIIANAFKFQIAKNQEPYYESSLKKLSEKKAIPASIKEIDKEISRGEMAEMIWRLKAEIKNKTSMLFENNNLSKVKLSPEEIKGKSQAVVLSEGNTRQGYPFLGTAFFVSSDGMLITNYHVVAEIKELKIKLENGTVFTNPKVLDYDRDLDIAILKVEASNLDYFELGNSDEVQKDEEVFVIGNPEGKINVLTTGKVIEPNENERIIFDAPIKHGNSGGPVFNSYGEVVGVVKNSGETLESETENGAIPMNLVTKLSKKKNLSLEEFFNLEYAINPSKTRKNNQIIPKYIASGSYDAFVLKDDNTLLSWGPNHHGQTDVPNDLKDVIKVVAGDTHVLALKKDGTVVAWGARENHENEKGLINLGQINIPTDIKVKDIAAGIGYSAVLKENGTVEVFGELVCKNGEVYQEMPKDLKNVTAIAGGNYHILALKNDGTVVAWGQDFNQALSTMPKDLKNITAISAGASHSVALKSDGTVVVWGSNDYGQLNVPNNLKNVTAISAHTHHSLALKKDGTVVAWGWNRNGQIDIPEGLKDIIAISSGIYHSMALRKDGSVITWGYMYEHQTVPSEVNVIFFESRGSGDDRNEGSIAK